MRRLIWGFIGVIGLGICAPRAARACGCFIPPDPKSPVVQAGERIAFAIKNNQVTAHIQIQYTGDAKQFGWILPLPSLPTLEVGTDELFNQLVTKTTPEYTLTRKFAEGCYQAPSFGCGAAGSAIPRAAGDGGGGGTDGGTSPLVIQDSVGPYDYAVLKADAKTEMLDWLKNNNYFVPTGTDQAVTQYIHPGAYFLALKLKSGKSTGDLQPVVVHYASDLAMIPIVLTSVGAVPDMGIQVWVLGGARAIPRNYHHVVINQAALDWSNGAQNYAKVLVDAVKAAPGRHAFITEYAGDTSIMKGALLPAGRFGDLETLKTYADPSRFAAYVKTHQYGPYPFTGVLRGVMTTCIPEPAELQKEGLSVEDFAARPDVHLDDWKTRYPAATPIMFDPVACVKELDARIVKPTIAADQLFTNDKWMTRFYTALSPEDMNLDPVFSFNPDLPAVPLQHTIHMDYDCDRNGVLTTEDGFKLQYPRSAAPPMLPSLPAALRVETIRESGAPTVVTDNTNTIKMAIGQTFEVGGCHVDARPARRRHAPLITALAGLAIAAVLGVRARRRRMRAR